MTASSPRPRGLQDSGAELRPGPVFIVNPSAGRGRAGKMARSLPAALAARGLDGEILTTARPGHATDLARRAMERTDLVVAVGGDGTAHEVVNAVAGTDTALGLVPAGTGNDLALALGIPSALPAALDVLAAGRRRSIDACRFDGRWFGNSLGLGFEARVTLESRRIRLLRGPPVYVVAALRALRRLQCPWIRLEADGTVREGPLLLVCLGNGPRVGGAFHLTPDARPDDGLLDVCVVRGMGRREVLRTLPRALRGAHLDHPHVELLRARSVEITSEDGFPFHADGEVIDTACHRLSVDLRQGALSVVAPPA